MYIFNYIVEPINDTTAALRVYEITGNQFPLFAELTIPLISDVEGEIYSHVKDKGLNTNFKINHFQDYRPEHPKVKEFINTNK